jgi:hypothetical protein
VSIDSSSVVMPPDKCCEYGEVLWVKNALFNEMCNRRPYFTIVFPVYGQNAVYLIRYDEIR